METRMTRRELLRTLGIGAAGAAVAACQPQIVEKEVAVKETVVVKEVVEVEKEVTRVVEVAPAAKPVVELLIHCPQNVSFGEWFAWWCLPRLPSGSWMCGGSTYPSGRRPWRPSSTFW